MVVVVVAVVVIGGVWVVGVRVTGGVDVVVPAPGSGKSLFDRPWPQAPMMRAVPTARTVRLLFVGILELRIVSLLVRFVHLPHRLLAELPPGHTDVTKVSQPPSRRDIDLAGCTCAGLFESTLDAYIEHRSVLLVVVREQADPQALPEYMARFASFLDRAKEMSFVREEIDSDMITGFLLDRILNQVQLAPWIKRNYGTDLLSDPE